jgi:hypothetical protein
MNQYRKELSKIQMIEVFERWDRIERDIDISKKETVSVVPNVQPLCSVPVVRIV